MHYLHQLSRLFFISTLVLTASHAFADNKKDVVDFVEEASAKGIAEIESSRLALEKSSSTEVQKFARKMIDDHTAANGELAAIARGKDLKIADDAALMSKAKKFILTLRDGESFDVAYANNQVVAHEQAIELFRKATNAVDPEVKAFATKTLPKLEHHLLQARQLVEVTERAERTDDKLKSSSANGSSSSMTRDSETRGVGTVPPTTYSD